jgi:hypothetical protein
MVGMVRVFKVCTTGGGIAMGADVEAKLVGMIMVTRASTY